MGSTTQASMSLSSSLLDKSKPPESASSVVSLTRLFSERAIDGITFFPPTHPSPSEEKDDDKIKSTLKEMDAILQRDSDLESLEKLDELFWPAGVAAPMHLSK